ncbi:hypothetical protein F7734_21650 [Scytonema sp. UIC 10036]|nr:hypothetical protein [Scytonema sp. UIC 10036]
MHQNDVDKLSRLIDALKRVNQNNKSCKTPKVLNEVEQYLNQCLINLNSDASELLQEKPREWLQIIYNWVPNGLAIHGEINYLNSNQKKELLALGYFLQGTLKTKEERDYIGKILRSFLETIKTFQSTLPPQ